MRSTTQLFTFAVPTFSNTTARSSTFDMQSYVGAAVSVSLAGASIAGTVKFQGSNDGTNWYDIDSQVISGPASFGINKADIYWSLVSILLTSSSADVVTIGAAKICAKGH